MTEREPLRIGIGGPVGSGKTALMDRLCKAMRDRFELVAITNDIYTREDAEFLTRSGALPAERIRGVETGGCPHTAIREDASINLAAVAELTRLFPRVDIVLIESGGDNLAATFSPELADLTIYVIDVGAGADSGRSGLGRRAADRQAGHRVAAGNPARARRPRPPLGLARRGQAGFRARSFRDSRHGSDRA